MTERPSDDSRALQRATPTAGQSARPTLAFVVVGLLLVVLSESFIRFERERAFRAERLYLETIAKFEAERIELWLGERRADLEVSAKGLATTLTVLRATGSARAELDALADRLRFLRDTYGYASVRLVARDGALIASADPRDGSDTTSLGRPPVPPDLPVTSFFWLAPSGRADDWTFRIVTPLPALGSAASAGWLAFEMNPVAQFEARMADWSQATNGVRMSVVKRDEAASLAPPARSERSPPPAVLGADLPVALVDSLEHDLATAGEWMAPLESDRIATAAAVHGSPWIVVTQTERELLVARRRAADLRIRAGAAVALVGVLAVAIVASLRSRRSAEAMARRADARFRTLFAQADEGVVILDDEGEVLSLNPSASATLGVGAEQARGRNWASFLANGARERQPLRFAELALRGAVRTEQRLVRADGEPFPATVLGVSLPGGRILLIVRDQAELRKQQERERRAKRIALFGTWEWEPKSGTLRWDDQTHLVLGFEVDSVKPSRELWVSRVHPDDLAEVEGRIASALRGEAPFELEHRVCMPDGRVRHVRCVADVTWDEQGVASRVEGAIQDVTASKLAAARLAAARADLAQSQKMEAVGRLAGMTAHDFNNLIGIIGGFSELTLMELSPDHPARAHLEEIRRAVERAADLTRRLLAFARQKPTEARAFGVQQLLAESLPLIERTVGSGVRVRVDCPDEVGFVLADPNLLVQALINLAANARDAMPRGGDFSISCRRRDLRLDETLGGSRLETAGAWIEVTVADTGSGMDAATLRNCFEPFYTTKQPEAGTGLGLSSVKQAIEACRGTIRVQSVQGRGSTFTIQLPGADESAVAGSRDDEPPIESRGEHVLVVDDVVPMGAFVERVLARAGYSVQFFEDPQRALETLALADRRVDLLLTDIIMPSMNGRELAERAHVLRPKLRVLFMTGHADPMRDARGEAADLDFARVVEKPFTGSELLLKVRRALDAETAA